MRQDRHITDMLTKWSYHHPTALELINELEWHSPQFGSRRLRSDPLALKLHNEIVGRLIGEMVR